MIEETLREIVKNKIVKILEERVDKNTAIEVEKRLSLEEKEKILKEHEKFGRLSEEIYNFIISKYCLRDLTSVLFGIPSSIRVWPEITESMIGSGKLGVKGLKKHVRELGYSEDKFEEILQAIYSEIGKIARDPKYIELLAIASLEIGSFYLESDYKKAEEFLLEAFELRSNLDEKKRNRLLESLIKLGSLYSRVKKTERAEIMFEKAREIIKELGGVQKLSLETANALKELERKIGKRF